jgi:hypothetical protein
MRRLYAPSIIRDIDGCSNTRPGSAFRRKDQIKLTPGQEEPSAAVLSADLSCLLCFGP